MKTAIGKTYARAGLLGNPSDGYDGKAIAISVRNFSATVTLEEADRFEIVPGPADALAFPTFLDAIAQIGERGCDGGVRLLWAAIKRFADHADLAGAEGLRFKMSYQSDIPRQVGLSGSSAIVMAAIRALMQWFGVQIAPFSLAEMTLAAETEELGIAAGPMDRVIQAYEGVMHMDFKQPRAPENYARVDPKLLPPLFIAYDPRTGEASGKVHSDVKFRWLRGDPEVRSAIAIFPLLVDQGIECLKARDVPGLQRLVDKNFDTRAMIWKLGVRDHEMVGIGRALGAAVKFCGSGGAVLGVMREDSIYPAIKDAYEKAGYRAIRPQIEPTVQYEGVS